MVLPGVVLLLKQRFNVHEFVGTVGTDDRNIDVLVVTATDNMYGAWTDGGHIYRQTDPGWDGTRNWTFDTPGTSGVGGASSYGSNTLVYKKAMNYYFDDKPHLDGNTWTAPGVWGGAANGVLDPVNPERVEDTNDNGVLDPNEKDGNTNPPHDDGDNNFDGDHPVKSGATWEWNHDLSPMDIDNDDMVELPRYPQVPVSSGDEYTKPHVVKHVITHQMGHAIGIDGPLPGRALQ